MSTTIILLTLALLCFVAGICGLSRWVFRELTRGGEPVWKLKVSGAILITGQLITLFVQVMK